jgi:hypothetical protein
MRPAHLEATIDNPPHHGYVAAESYPDGTRVPLRQMQRNTDTGQVAESVFDVIAVRCINSRHFVLGWQIDEAQHLAAFAN